MEVFCKLASGDDQSKGIISPQLTRYIFPTIFFTVVFKGQGQLTCKCNLTTQHPYPTFFENAYFHWL